MSDLVAMIAVAKGTIVGASGIIHVDPRNSAEGGRYSHPLVGEADAVQLETRKLAARADRAEVPDKVELMGSGDPITIPAAGGVTLGAGPDAPPAVPAPTAEMAPTGAGHPVAAVDPTGAIETGLDDNDPDAPPAVPAPPAVTAPADGAAPAQRRRSK